MTIKRRHSLLVIVIALVTMWRMAFLPARQGRGPLHDAVGGVCRTRRSFHEALLVQRSIADLAAAGENVHGLTQGCPQGLWRATAVTVSRAEETAQCTVLR